MLLSAAEERRAAEGCAVAEIWINRTLGTVSEREVLRVFRNQIGDWCAEVVISSRIHIAVFDHHPRAVLLSMLRNSGTNIADDVIAQGAEGMDVRRRTGPAGDDP
jgi:hypothetical protein